MSAEITVCIQFEGCEPVYRSMMIDNYTARHAEAVLDTGDQRLAKIPAGSFEYERTMTARAVIADVVARCAADILTKRDTHNGYTKEEAPNAWPEAPALRRTAAAGG